MIKTGFEDTIIRYFDGELSDADAAELMHRASVSPEIRRVIREHEMLREMAQSASRAVMVSPALETKLFAHLSTLVPAEPLRKEAAVFIIKRRTVGYASALLLLLGSVLVPLLSSSSNEGNSGYRPQLTASSPSSQQPLLLASQNNNAIIDEHTSVNSTFAGTKNKDQSTSFGIKNESESHSSRVTAQSIYSVKGSATAQPVVSSNIPYISGEQERNTPPIYELTSASARTNYEDILSSRSAPLSFQSLRGNEDEYAKVEFSFQTASGFTSPADASPIKPFADERISMGYHLSGWDVVGARLGSGLFQQLSAPTRTERYGLTMISRTLETKRNFSGEAFYTRLVPLWFDTPLMAQFSAEAGIIPDGYTFGAEAGLRLPISSSLMFDLSFALQSVHSNAPTAKEILAQESADGSPVLLQSSDVHRTLNGKFHYGILFTF